MTDATRKTLTTEAAKSLESYLSTGDVGRLWNGIDLCKTLGVPVPSTVNAGSRLPVADLAYALANLK